jgi:DNA-binding NarL/FixJ family response regulator
MSTGKLEHRMTRVLIAIREPVLATGMENVLSSAGLKIAALCTDLFALMQDLPGADAEVAILDLGVLPAPEVIRDLHRIAPQCRFLLLSRGTWSQEELNAALSYGAAGVLPATLSPAELVETVKLVAVFGQARCTPAEAVRLVCNSHEREVIAMTGYGLDSREIAEATCSDEASIRKLMADVAGRLAAGDRYELALYGLSALKEPPAEADLDDLA